MALVLMNQDIDEAWFETYAEKRGLDLVLTTPAEVAAHELACRFSGVTIALRIRFVDEATHQDRVALLYRRPEVQAS